MRGVAKIENLRDARVRRSRMNELPDRLRFPRFREARWARALRGYDRSHGVFEFHLDDREQMALRALRTSEPPVKLAADFPGDAEDEFRLRAFASGDKCIVPRSFVSSSILRASGG